MAKIRAATAKATNAADTADQEFIEHLRQMAELRFREERDRARRVAVAARQRRRLSERLTKKLGIGLEHFDALHEADWKLLQRQAKAQETAATALIERQHKRQRAAFRNVMKYRERFEYRAAIRSCRPVSGRQCARSEWICFRSPLTNVQPGSVPVLRWRPPNSGQQPHPVVRICSGTSREHSPLRHARCRD